MAADKHLNIREAMRIDLREIIALYRSLEESDEALLPLERAEELFDRIQKYPNYRLYIAEQERQIVGTFALLVMENLAHGGAPSGIVEDVVVREGWQGQGIGKEMMLFAMARCREAGCYKLVLSSNKKREAAHRFYESLGFEAHGYSFAVSADNFKFQI